MKNLKRVLSLVLATVMVIGMMVVGASAVDYKDADKISYKEAVDVMTAVGMISGYDGNFAPTATIDRAGAAKLVAYLMLGKDIADSIKPTEDPFKDVSKDAWYAGYMAYCKSEGLMQGWDGYADPTGTITAYGFGTMLLAALGYDRSIEGLTGDSWEVNTATLAIKNGLFAGNETATGNAPMTREEACLYAFNALKATMVEYTGGTTVTLPGGVTVVTGATRSDVAAKRSDNTNDDVNYTGVNPGDGKVQLCESLYYDNSGALLTYTASAPDVFGRPAHSWTFDGDVVGSYASTTPVKTYTTGVTGGQVYTDLGKPASLTLNVKVNGGPAWNAASQITSGNTHPFGGPGTVIEVYKNSANNYTAIATQTFAMKIASHVDAVKDANGDITAKEYVTFADMTGWTGYVTRLANNKFETTAFTDADATNGTVVLVTATSATGLGDDYVVRSAVAAKSFTGTMTSYNTTANVYTIDGVNYAKNEAFGASITGLVGVANVYYKDTYGNLIASTAVTAATNYAVVEEITLVTPGTTGSIGESAKSYLEAKVVFFDGTTEIVRVNKVIDGANTYAAAAGTGITDVVTSSTKATLNTAIREKVLTYSVVDDEYVLTTVGQTVTSSSTDLDDTAVFDGTNVANNSTKFIIRTGNTTTGYKYAAYTGFVNLPTKLFNDDTTAVTGVKTGNVATYVFVTGTDATSASEATAVYVTGSGTYHYDAKNPYFEYPAVINGVSTTVKVASGAVQPSVVGLYNLTQVSASTGYATTLTKVSGQAINIEAENGIIGISSVWKTYDENTKVYVIDPANGYAVSSPAIETLKTSYTEVYVTYVQVNGDDSAIIDTIIAVKG